VLHKADQPNTFFDFFDTDSLTSKDRAEVDFFAVKTKAPTVGDVDNLVVEVLAATPWCLRQMASHRRKVRAALRHASVAVLEAVAHRI